MGEIVKEKEENIERKGRNNGVYRTEGNNSESSPRTRTKKNNAPLKRSTSVWQLLAVKLLTLYKNTMAQMPFILSVPITTTYCLLSLSSLYRWNRKRMARSSTRTPELITVRVLITTPYDRDLVTSPGSSME